MGHVTQGTDYSTILRIFCPEFVNAIVIYMLVVFIDVQLIAGLKSTALYEMVGLTNTLIFFLNKVAEGLSVGAVILCGKYQGAQEYEMVGKAVSAAFWATLLPGAVIAGFLYFQAAWVYELLCIPPHMIALGVPFLKLRSISIFFMFIFLAFIGFLRGVKNTRATMYLYLMGSGLFVFLDYILIYGKFGFPALGFEGSAIASIIQYVIMLVAAIAYIWYREDYRQYKITFSQIDWSLVRSIFSLSWPVMFDKAALQAEKIWLVRLLAPMSAYTRGAFVVIKDMEMLAYLPAVAFGQIMTLLASNEYGARKFAGIKITIKRVLFMASCMTLGMLVLFSLNPISIVNLFDRQNMFTEFVLRVFPAFGILIFLDLLQLILAGALRGVANVKIVMLVRLVGLIVFFIPLSYGITLLPISNEMIRFIAVYGSFNVVNGIAALFYYYWFSTNRWHKNLEQVADHTRS